MRAIEQLPLMISACQFGITLASLGLGALSEPAIAALLRRPFEALQLPHQLIHPISIASGPGSSGRVSWPRRSSGLNSTGFVSTVFSAERTRPAPKLRPTSFSTTLRPMSTSRP